MKTVRIRLRILAQVVIGEGVDELHTPASALRTIEDVTLTRTFSGSPASSVPFVTAEHATMMLRSAAEILPARVQHSTATIA